MTASPTSSSPPPLDAQRMQRIRENCEYELAHPEEYHTEPATTLLALLARVDDLERERDEAFGERDQWLERTQQMGDGRVAAEAEVARLTAELLRKEESCADSVDVATGTAAVATLVDEVARLRTALSEADQAMMHAAALLRGLASDVAHHTDVSPEVERLEKAQAGARAALSGDAAE